MVQAIRAATIFVALGFTAPATAQSLIGVDSTSLYQVDSATGSSQLIGNYQLVGYHVNPKLCRGPDGKLYGISDAFSGEMLAGLYLFNEQTGAATLIKNLLVAGAVFTEVRGLAAHPITGELFFIIDNLLHRVDPMTGQLALPPIALSTAIYHGLAFNRSGQLLTLRAPTATPTAYTLWNIDPECPNPGGAIGAGLGIVTHTPVIAYDATTDTLVGYDAGSAVIGEAFFSIDPTTGLAGPTVVPQTTGLLLRGVAGNPGNGPNSYGTGCAGGPGTPPTLKMFGCTFVNHQVTLTISGGLGGATALVCFGLTQGSTPLGAGCTLLIQPLLPTILTLPLGGVGTGNGSASLQGVIPPQAAGASLTIQAFVLDPTSAIGATTTNGLELQVP